MLHISVKPDRFPHWHNEQGDCSDRILRLRHCTSSIAINGLTKIYGDRHKSVWGYSLIDCLGIAYTIVVVWAGVQYEIISMGYFASLDNFRNLPVAVQALAEGIAARDGRNL